MALMTTPVCNFGSPAPNFCLPGIDGKRWSLQDCIGTRGLLVMFICNHCPYVKSIQTKLVRDTNALRKLGINSVAIMSNDPLEYPDDAFSNMQAIAQQFQYGFPYLIDESQETAKAYRALCTPDFFGYNSDLRLQYRGRFDASGKQALETHEPSELFVAMEKIALTSVGPNNQIPSIGCSIKWKQDE